MYIIPCVYIYNKYSTSNPLFYIQIHNKPTAAT